jgi:isopentenyl phosphate kinase
MIILKLGGSIITEKDAEIPTINDKNLARISKEIKSALNHLDHTNDYNNGLIIVHGAGSFGHPFASEYQIGKPFKIEEDFEKKKIGFSLTQSWVKKLNTVICDVLREEGIPVVSIQPSSFVITKNKRIISANLDIIEKYLENGFIPVIYGDVVLDREETIKMAVVSGDQLINYLAKHLKPERVILGTDVDGVFNKNPKKHPDAKIITEVTSLDDLESMDSTTNIDVTGGMIGKIKELIELAEIGIESEIINAEKESFVEKALCGEIVLGTTIKCKINNNP